MSGVQLQSDYTMRCRDGGGGGGGGPATGGYMWRWENEDSGVLDQCPRRLL